MIIAEITAEDNLRTFSCGNAEIDQFFGKSAVREHKRRSVRVFVGKNVETDCVLEFYSLCVATLAKKSYPGFGQRPIPALYLAMLGVDLNQKGFGFGTALMTDAFERAVLVAENAGAYCLFLDAVDLATVNFYQKIGFEILIEGELKMFIAIETLVDALQVRNKRE